MIAAFKTTNQFSDTHFDVLAGQQNVTDRVNSLRIRGTECPIQRQPALPIIDFACESSRVTRFQRVLQSCLQRHAFTAAFFTVVLLVLAVMLGAHNPVVFTGLISYLIGSVVSVIVFRQSIQNAVHQDGRG